jgi:L-serine dehydratase
MNIFDIIGPVMIGPSSSHTAGAVRIGRVAMKILGDDVKNAEIGFVQSFAQTYRGHGTDKAIVAGLIGMLPDDERICRSFSCAREAGLEFSIKEIKIARAHPNTARLHLTGRTGKECVVQGASIGGGNIVITGVNEMETDFTGTSDTLIIPHQDTPGVIAEVTSVMAWHGINIGNFRLNRPHKGYQAVMTVEIDGTVGEDFVTALRRLPHVDSVVYLRANQNEAS